MSHGILENDEMFSVKERPWHGLGKVLETAPSIEQGIKIANLNWEVELQEIATNQGIKLDDKRAVIRKDLNTPLGIVSPNYKLLQNKEAFSFFEPFIENGLATLESAGSLFNGKRVWVLAKIAGEDMEVMPGDKVEKYILLSNSHDGSQCLRVGFTPIRVVCNNTLTMAESIETSQLIRVHHKGNIIQNLNELRETMDLVNKQFIATEQQFKSLANKQVNTLDLYRYVKQVFSNKRLEELEKIITDGEEKEKIEETRKRLIARVEEIFELEPVHNAWTMYNSVNYYLNHERSKNLDTRYDSIWFGYGKKLDTRALQLAQKI